MFSTVHSCLFKGFVVSCKIILSPGLTKFNILFSLIPSLSSVETYKKDDLQEETENTESNQNQSEEKQESNQTKENLDKTLRREKMSKLDIYNHVMSKVENDFVPDDLYETSENDECPFCETDRELYQNEGKLYFRIYFL